MYQGEPSVGQANNDSGSLCLLHMDAIRKDGGTQTRRSLDESVVRHYCALLQAETEFPPLRVWFDGTNFWLVDGFHRLAAAEKAGFKEVTAYIHHGPLEAAVWDSLSANSQHGLPRKRSEMLDVIQRALCHTNAVSLSNVEIARHLGVAEKTVRRWRRRLSSARAEDAIRQVTRNGRAYTIRTANIGSHRKPLRSGHKSFKQLAFEMNEMKTAASPACQGFVEIINSWMFGDLSAEECLSRIQQALSESSTPDAGKPVGRAQRAGASATQYVKR